MNATEHQVDQMFLLIACSATTAQVGHAFGVCGKTVELLLKQECYREAYSSALLARPHLNKNHGTKSRYGHGCRCVECKDAQRLNMTARRRKKQAPTHGTRSGYFNHGCRCGACAAAGKSHNAARREAFADGRWAAGHGTQRRFADGCRCADCSWIYRQICRQQRAYSHRRNDLSRDSAHRSGYEWTGPELEIASRDDLSASEVAAMLGRTIWAVQRQRVLLSVDPRKITLAGVSGTP